MVFRIVHTQSIPDKGIVRITCVLEIYEPDLKHMRYTFDIPATIALYMSLYEGDCFVISKLKEN